MNPDIVLIWLIVLYIFMLAILVIAGIAVSSAGRSLMLLKAKATSRWLAKMLFGKSGMLFGKSGVVAAGGGTKVTGSTKPVDASDAGSQARADGPGTSAGS